jgi:hypothetical protein
MHQRHAAWRSNIDMHLGHSAWTCSMDMQCGRAVRTGSMKCFVREVKILKLDV